MDADVLAMSKSKYNDMIGFDDYDKDKKGFIIMRPTAANVDKHQENLSTSIDDLEKRLSAFRKEKEKCEEVKKSKDYDVFSGGKKGKKKKKKDKLNLLRMVFNNADDMSVDDDENLEVDESYKDVKDKKAKKKTDKLNTTYGQRFTPVVSLLHDAINEFDNISSSIQEDLDTRANTKTMYRSSQIANLISAKNSKLSAIKELGSIAKTVSDLEYKKDKDKGDTETNSDKMISSLGAKFLRGSLDDIMDDTKGGKKDKKKKKKRFDDDDDDDDEDIYDKTDREDTERERANEFAEALLNNKGSISLTPYEKNIDIEGKYDFVVVADPLDPENDWEFVAVDKHGKKIKGFREDHKELYPKAKNCKMVFDLGKMKVSNKLTSKTYKLILK